MKSRLGTIRDELDALRKKYREIFRAKFSPEYLSRLTPKEREQIEIDRRAALKKINREIDELESRIRGTV